MQDPQTASAFFFMPVAAAYLAACAGSLIYDRQLRGAVAEPPFPVSDRPVLDFLLTLAAAAGILLLGSAYRNDWLLPTGSTAAGRVGWMVDNLIIFSPIAAVLWMRRQGTETIFLSSHRWIEKVLLGLGLGVISVSIYLAVVYRALREGNLDGQFIESSLDPPPQLAPHRPALKRVGLEHEFDHDRVVAKAVQAQHLRLIENQGTEHRVLAQLVGDVH
jgi:hypothetical protein